jgi:hypothetical protein
MVMGAGVNALPDRYPEQQQPPPPATPTPEERKAAMDAIRQENPSDDDLIKIKANPDLQKQFGITSEDLDLYTAERAEKAQVEVKLRRGYRCHEGRRTGSHPGGVRPAVVGGQHG